MGEVWDDFEVEILESLDFFPGGIVHRSNEDYSRVPSGLTFDVSFDATKKVGWVAIPEGSDIGWCPASDRSMTESLRCPKAIRKSGPDEGEFSFQ